MRDDRTYAALVRSAAAAMRDEGVIDLVTVAEIQSAGFDVAAVEADANTMVAELG